MKKETIETGDRVKVIGGPHSGCSGIVTYIPKSIDAGMATVVHLTQSTVGPMYDNDIYASVPRQYLESLEEVPDVQTAATRSPQTTQDLQVIWDRISEAYLEAFCDRHDYRFDPDSWVAGDKGTIAEVCDMFVSINDMRYDVDNNIDPELFSKWYWKALEIYELTDGKMNYMNFPSYCKGAPDEWTPERLQSLRDGHKRVADAKKALDDEIDNFIKGKHHSMF